MTLYTDPPSFRSFRQDKPTLLVCWWLTSFCALLITLRVAGRFVRTERLFLEDRIAALALIPLCLRMGCVHYILLYGTNNADFSDVDLSTVAMDHKQIASGLVLASRVLYAATLWILKNAILEFLRRLTGLTWSRAHHTTLIAIRWIFGITFVAVIISTFVECRPNFSHYWQITPDPGGQCRQGYVQLIVMATCNVLTDILLVVFPIPIIVQSQMTLKKKLQLSVLFSLSLAVVGVTLYRVPHILESHGRQQYRSLLASVEILFATAAANALVLGSFVRDRGLKKHKFRRTSTADSTDRRSSNHHRPTLHQHWGSDEDLARDVGLTLEPKLREDSLRPGSMVYVPAPIMQQTVDEDGEWNSPDQHAQLPNSAHNSDDPLSPFERLSRGDHNAGLRKLSFFDVGGLLSDTGTKSSASYRRGSDKSLVLDPNSPNPPNTTPPAVIPASSGGRRRGSVALLQDLGGLLGPLNGIASRTKPKADTEMQPVSPGSSDRRFSPTYQQSRLVLNDPGGLLGGQSTPA